MVPHIVKVVLDFGTGLLHITGSETIDVTPATMVLLERLFIVNGTNATSAVAKLTSGRVEGDPRIRLDASCSAAVVGGTAVPPHLRVDADCGVCSKGPASVVEVDGVTITITLTEEQRVAALRRSSLKVVDDDGDGVGILIDVSPGGFRDVATNPVVGLAGLAIDELADTTTPRIHGCELDLGTGVLRITTDETLALSQRSRWSTVNLDAVTLGNVSVTNMTADRLIALNDATVFPQDSPTAIVTLSERARVEAVLASGTPGGDGIGLLVEMRDTSVQDLMNNTNAPQIFPNITEIPDTLGPTIKFIRLHYSTGIIEVETDETLRAIYGGSLTVPSLDGRDVDFGRVSLGQSQVAPRTVTLGGAKIVEQELNRMNITMTEAQRVAAIRISGTPGGDGQPVVFSVLKGGFRDMSRNDVNDTLGIAVVELPDQIRPAPLNCIIDYSDGSVTITSTETIVPESFNLGKLLLVNTSLLVNASTAEPNEALYEQQIAAQQVVRLSSTLTEFGTYESANVPPVSGVTVTIMMGLRQRVIAQAMSGRMGGDGRNVTLDVRKNAFADVSGNINFPTLDFNVKELSDKARPTITYIAYNYLKGIFQFTASEVIDLTPFANFNLSRINPVDRFGLHGVDIANANVSISPGLPYKNLIQFNVSLQPKMRHKVFHIADTAFLLAEVIAFPLRFRADGCSDVVGNVSAFSNVHYPVIPNDPTGGCRKGAFRDMASNQNPALQNLIVYDPEDSYVLRAVTAIYNDKGMGHGSVMVVDRAKRMYFNGSGILAYMEAVGLPDIAKFVSNAAGSTAACGVEEDDAGDPTANALGGIIGEGVVNGVIYVKPGGNLVTFTKPSEANRPFKLCYKFGDEPFKLFEVTISAKQLVSVQTINKDGHNRVAVVGHPKEFFFTGFSVNSNDRVGFAYSAAATDADCNDQYRDGATTLKDVLTTGGALGNRIESGRFIFGAFSGDQFRIQGRNATGYIDPLGGNQTQGYVTIEMSLDHPQFSPHALCYAFGLEPFKLYKNFMIEAKMVRGVDRVQSLVRVPHIITFTGPHITGSTIELLGGRVSRSVGVMVKDPVTGVLRLARDEAKWVVAAANAGPNGCEGDAATKPAGDSEVAGVTRDIELPLGTAEFQFGSPSPAGEPFRLCYKFGTEPFHLYVNRTMEVLMPAITNISDTVAVQDQSKDLFFTGTLGLTTGDVVKWVPYLVAQGVDCDVVGQGGMIDVATKPSMGLPSDKTRVGTFTFNAAPPLTQPWALCYKFGRGPYVHFRDHTLSVMRLDNVTRAASANLDVVVGDRVTYFFGGIGVVDGDIAKWVSSSAMTDMDCGGDAAGGSNATGGLVASSKAHYVFSKETVMKLCYRFGSGKNPQQYKLYGDMKIQKEEDVVEAGGGGGAGDPASPASREKKVTITIVLDLDINTILPVGSAAFVTFVSSFTAEMAAILMIAMSRIVVDKIDPGSIIVTFTVLPDPTGSPAALSAAQVVAILLAAIANPLSILYDPTKFPFLSNVNKNIPIAAVLVPAPEFISVNNTVVKPSTETVIAFQTSGLFAFTKTDFVAVESSGHGAVTVTRSHGLAETVRVEVTFRDGSATSPGDFTAATTNITFAPGVTLMVANVTVMDDALVEDHYETILCELRVAIVGDGTDTTKTAVASPSRKSSVIRLYDYDDGARRVQSNFSLEAVETRLLAGGWQIVGNGHDGPLWVDSVGAFSVDQQFGERGGGLTLTDYDSGSDVAWVAEAVAADAPLACDAAAKTATAATAAIGVGVGAGGKQQSLTATLPSTASTQGVCGGACCGAKGSELRAGASYVDSVGKGAGGGKDRGLRLLQTNGIPSHPYHEYDTDNKDALDALGTQPSSLSVCERRAACRVAVAPIRGTKPMGTGGAKYGIVGVATSGAFLFNYVSNAQAVLAAAGAKAAPAGAHDQCTGQGDGNCLYHYQGIPNCIVGANVEPPACVRIGWHVDGFEVRGTCTCAIDAKFGGGSRPCRSCYARIAGTAGTHANHYVFNATVAAMGLCDLDEANGMVRTEPGHPPEYVYVTPLNYPFMLPKSSGASVNSFEESPSSADAAAVASACAGKEAGALAAAASAATATPADAAKTVGALSMDGNGGIVAVNAITDWPSDDITVTMWLRSVDMTRAGTLLSYQAPKALSLSPTGDRTFAIVDHRRPRLVIGESGTAAMFATEGADLGLDLADGMWHHVAVSWSNGDGSVHAYVDGVLATTRTGYRTSARMQRGGWLVVGQLQGVAPPTKKTAAPLVVGGDGTGVVATGPAPFVAQRGLVGDVQNVRVWNSVRNVAQIVAGSQWPFSLPSNGQLYVYWRLDAAAKAARHVNDISNGGANHPGTLYGAPGTAAARIVPTASCAEDAVWHFSAPNAYLGDLRGAYNGRLQFRLLSPEHEGRPRSARGSVELRGFGAGGAATRISYPLVDFGVPRADGWTAYSVILREDHGWITEPLSAPLSFSELYAVMANVTAILIRGDAWVCGGEFTGEEAVYLNDVRLYEGGTPTAVAAIAAR